MNCGRLCACPREYTEENKKCKIIPGEECFAQHRLLAMDVKSAKPGYSKSTAKRQIKLWKLKDKKVRKRMKGEAQHRLLAMDVKSAKPGYSKSTAKRQIKLWKLKDKKVRKRMKGEVEVKVCIK